MDDQQLLQGLADGSHEAFSHIYIKYWKKVFILAHNRLKDIKQSQDVVQDVFVSLWERREDLAVQNLNAYLHSAVRYGVFKLAASGRVQDQFFAHLKGLSNEAPEADHQLISDELMQAYQALLAKMPPQRRKIFQMRYEENLKTKEIAEQLNISQKTVQNQLLTSYHEVRSLVTEVAISSLLIALLSK